MINTVVSEPVPSLLLTNVPSTMLSVAPLSTMTLLAISYILSSVQVILLVNDPELTSVSAIVFIHSLFIQEKPRGQAPPLMLR